jgi:hypothetical protein
VKHWYTWISNTTSITGETLIYSNIKYYKYNWGIFDIHEYQALQVWPVTHWYTCTWISNTTSITGETLIYMNIKHYTINGETLKCMNIKHYKYKWWNIDIHEYQTLQV